MYKKYFDDLKHILFLNCKVYNKKQGKTTLSTNCQKKKEIIFASSK